MHAILCTAREHQPERGWSETASRRAPATSAGTRLSSSGWRSPRGAQAQDHHLGRRAPAAGPRARREAQQGSLLALIHRSAWKENSANFALTEFSEVAPALVTPSYLSSLYNVRWD